MTDRRTAPQNKVILPALCWGRGRADFYAVTDGILPDGIRFRSAFVPGVGDALTCSIRHIGQIEGTVLRVDAQAFVVKVRAQPQVAARIVSDMVGLARQQEPPPSAVRVHPRVTPIRSDVVVRLSCGRVLAGQLLNVSASGAALLLPEVIEDGTWLLIGRTWARTVRKIENGVGVVFRTPFDPQDVDENMTL